MIPFDFEYYLPGNAAEAVTLYSELAESGRKPLYYAGGTEVITFCRRQVIAPAALIDLKAISLRGEFELKPSIRADPLPPARPGCSQCCRPHHQEQADPRWQYLRATALPGSGHALFTGRSRSLNSRTGRRA